MTMIMSMMTKILTIQFSSLYIHMLTHYEIPYTEAKERRNQRILFRQCSKFSKSDHINNYVTRRNIYAYSY
jgi:hypothetical protein